MIDYHIHTSLSDGSGEHEDYLTQAEKTGLREIGISDHLVLRPCSWSMPVKKIPEWRRRMTGLRKKAGTSCGVKFGMEVDYFPDKEEEIAGILKKLPLDYVIGSIHFLGTWNFDSSPEGYEEWDLRNVYNYYYGLVQKSALSGLFDVIGHLDLVKKFGHRLTEGTSELMHETMRAIKKGDVVVELNTSGMNKPCRDFYPSKNLLEMMYEYQIPVTLGSDAHNPGQVGQYFDEATDLLKEIGFREITVFSERKRSTMQL